MASWSTTSRPHRSQPEERRARGDGGGIGIAAVPEALMPGGGVPPYEAGGGKRKEQAMEHQFDELAKALAGGLSRREALRRLGGGMAVALLAVLGTGRAEAQGGSLSCLLRCK